MPLILCTFDEYQSFRSAMNRRCAESAMGTLCPERTTASEEGTVLERFTLGGTIVARALYDLDENAWTCEVDVRSWRLMTEAIPMEVAHNEPFYVCDHCHHACGEGSMVQVTVGEGFPVEGLNCPQCHRQVPEPLYFTDEHGDPVPSLLNHPPRPCSPAVMGSVWDQSDLDPIKAAAAIRRAAGFLKSGAVLALLCAMLFAGCGSPRHDGVPWERTYPHSGDTIAEVDALYGHPESIEADTVRDRQVRHYKHWRAKNQLGGLDPIFSKRDHHTVYFDAGRAVEWNDQP